MRNNNVPAQHLHTLLLWQCMLIACRIMPQSLTIIVRRFIRGVSGLGKDPVSGTDIGHWTWVMGIFDMADVCSDGIPKDLGLRVEADQAKPCEAACS